MREFLDQFLYENAPSPCFEDDVLLWEQIRSLFTSICLMENIDSDTSSCDELLRYIYTEIECSMSESEYENFMLANIV